jgi:hypothetical protein
MVMIAPRHLYLAFLIAAGAAVPVVAKPQSDAFKSLPQFLADVSAARYADYLGAPAVAVRSESDFNLMREHLLSQYEGVTATHSFLIDTQYVDCIPAMQQPSVRHLGLTAIASPPPSPAVDAAVPSPGVMLQPLLTRGLKDPLGNAISCDGDTIPMLRVTLDDLARFPTLGAFFAKQPPPSSTAPQLNCPTTYRYAVGTTSVGTYYGAQTTLTYWDPAINPTYGGYQHSLSQVWVEGKVSTSPLQTAEAGWIVYPDKFNTASAVLFVYWTSTDYYYDGCYNTDCAGFVHSPGSVWVLGSSNSWTPSVVGHQPNFIGPLTWQLYNNNWWLSLGSCPLGKNCNIGYIPATTYGQGPMATYANVILFGGEVDSPYGAPGFSQMGSGQLARTDQYATWYAADQGPTYYEGNTNPQNPVLVLAHLTQVDCNTNSSYFTFACLDTNCDSFTFGGPGGPNVP